MRSAPLSAAFMLMRYIGRLTPPLDNGEPKIIRNVPAVTIIAADNSAVGHPSHNLAPTLLSFLARDFNKSSVETIGVKINCRAGYSLEVPYINHLYGIKACIKALMTAVSKLKEISVL